MVNVLLLKKSNEKELLELLRVYESAGWWDSDKEDYQAINTIIQASFCFAVAISEGQIVGMGRAISDGISDAYIQDVAVLPEFKGQKIGTQIVNLILAELKKKEISWIGLIATPGADNFYQQIGFSKMENFTPMLYSAI